MQEQPRSNPFAYFFLVLPSGISNGFVSITLPFVLVREGFSVAAAASVVALGLSANVWRFACAPPVDLTLTLRHWYLLGLAACSVTLVVLGFMPLRAEAMIALTTIAFISQMGANFSVTPVGGFIAHMVAEDQKGRAAGWYQAGNLGGTGLGGGAGVWLASHYSLLVAGVALAGVMLLGGLALRFVPDVQPISGETIGHRLRLMGKDLLDLWRTPLGLLTTIFVTSPIGAGAMNNLWSAVAPDWHADANTVALITGVMNGALSAIGCIVGGWVADRVGRWWSYFGSGVLLALVAIALAVAARTTTSFAVGVLLYSFVGGIAYAAFSAIVLFAIGRGAASTRYAVLSSFGNIPVIYMTSFDGWAHDRFGPAGMLWMEALAGIVCVVLGLGAVAWLRRRPAVR